MVRRGVDHKREKKIGCNIRRCRKAADLSLEKVAERLNISYQQLQKIETGSNRLSVTRLLDIAVILGVHPMKLAAPDWKQHVGRKRS